MKITVLGSGSPEAYARRASSGYLVEVGNDVILFDCGGGVFDNLLRSGRRPSDITHLFFTHLHSDHMMDYARLVHAAWDEGGKPIAVFGPAPIAQITEGYFGPNGVMSHDLRARTELIPSQEVWVARGGSLPRPWPAPKVVEIAPGFSFQSDGWTLESCPAAHAQPVLECLSFALTAGGKRFAYSGDTALLDEFESLTKGADLLLHWCYRLDGEHIHPELDKMTPTPSDIAIMASRARVKHLLLTHFRVHMDSPDTYDAALSAMAEHFDGRSGIAEDLQVFEL